MKARKLYAPHIRVMCVEEAQGFHDLPLSSAEAVTEAWSETVAKSVMFNPDQECVAVFVVNSLNRLKSWQICTTGVANASLIHPREVFRLAIATAGTGVIVAHNHPSGDPCPSAADLRVTRILNDASNAVDIKLLDHIVIGRRERDPRGVGHYSFRQSGAIKP